MNKREYKKAVSSLGAGMCVEIFNIGTTTKDADTAVMRSCMDKVWNAMLTARHEANDTFGKKERDFETRGEYLRARKAFNKQLFKDLNERFAQTLKEALSEFNAALPKTAKA